MQLTKQTDFAFRILIYLADQPDDRLVTVRQLCDYYDISANHIARVVMRLAGMGYVESVRGRSGGIRLGRSAERIPLVEIVREFEPALRPINCSEQPCRIIKTCQLKGILAEAMNAFLQTLEPYTLADIVGSMSGGTAQVIDIH